ncbi:unnamed protein product, partial [marine sediment metagenome]
AGENKFNREMLEAVEWYKKKSSLDLNKKVRALIEYCGFKKGDKKDLVNMLTK